MAENPSKKSYLFGRQKTKKLSARQQSLIEGSLPALLINPLTDNPAELFEDKTRELWLEIGFGGGEHLCEIAARNPEVNFIGCEPFINGIAKLLVNMEERDIRNIRIYNNDARHILNWLKPQSLDRIYLLYPDPWPKKKHRKRRFVTQETLAMLSRTLKPGTDLLIASDIGDYIRTSLLAIEQCPDFTWTPKTATDWRTPPDGWSSTRYEQKALREGRTPTYLKLKRA